MSLFRMSLLAMAGAATVSICCADEPTRLKLPRCRPTAGGEFYPLDAQRRGIKGEVLIDFVIDSSGVPQSLQVVTSHPKGVFDASASRMVSGFRCVVTPDWMSTGASQHRFRIRVSYQISGSRQSRRYGSPSEEAGVDDTMVITGSAINR